MNALKTEEIVSTVRGSFFREAAGQHAATGC